MLCPRCASNQNDDIKFCTFCGANLQAVREAMDVPEAKKFDWSNTWVADMNISATQVLLQSNFFASGTSIASRTAWRLAPQNVQNLMSSFWFEAQRGHSIGSSCSGISMDTTILRPEF